MFSQWGAILKYQYLSVYVLGQTHSWCSSMDCRRINEFMTAEALDPQMLMCYVLSLVEVIALEDCSTELQPRMLAV